MTTNTVFHPPVEMPNQIVSYDAGLKANAATYGAVIGNSPADLQPLVARAQQLQPLAHEIEQMRLALAAKEEQYAAQASPLWSDWSEKLKYARTFAETHKNEHLQSFLLAFRHNEGRHAAKVAAQGGPTPAPVKA